MNTPLLPGPEPEYQPVAPLEEPGASRSALRLRRFLIFLPKYWWIPVLTLFIGIVLEAAYVYFKTPTFYSEGIMWQSVKLRLPGGEYFSDDMQNYAATLNGVLRSDTLRDQRDSKLWETGSRAYIAPWHGACYRAHDHSRAL